MRHLAAALVSIGLVLGAALALIPISVAVPPWVDGRCGPPAVRYFAEESVPDENEQRVIDRCEAASEQRLIVAASLVTAGLISGTLAMLAAWRHEAVERRRRAARRYEWEEQARAAQAAAVRAAREAQAAAADALMTPPR